MAYYEINPAFTDQVRFVQEVDLEGTTYRLLFAWNEREGYWYLDLLDITDDQIASNMKLVEGAYLLRHVVDSRRPPGELFVSGQPTQTNLGSDAFLIYVDEATLDG